MLRRLVLTSLILTLTAHAAAAAPPGFGTIDVAWDNCAFAHNPPPLHNRQFQCEQPSAVARLYVSFRLNQDYPWFAAMQVGIDLAGEEGDLPSFWAFEPGGCNEEALTVTLARPLGCGSELNSPWDPDSASAFVLDYRRAGNRAHLVVVGVNFRVYDPQHPPRGVDLVTDRNYFGLSLEFAQPSSGPACPGCPARVVVNCQSIKLESASPSPGKPRTESPAIDPLILDSAGPFGSCVTVNGATSSYCAAVPVVNRTWGAVKSLYR